MSQAMIQVENVVTRFGDNIIHDKISLTIREGEIYGLMGASGSGKSSLLKEMILLLRPASGTIRILGKALDTLDFTEAAWLRHQWGILFQAGALFSSLTVAQNVGIKLREYTRLPEAVIEEIVQMKIRMVGLPDHAARLYPAELSGGMVKRASLARALAMDPRLLFLDEPTSGLDPIGAEAFDELILKLRDKLGLTVVMVTHDLDSIWTIMDRFAVLGDSRIVAEGTLEEVIQVPHPVIREFFWGARGRLRSSHG